MCSPRFRTAKSYFCTDVLDGKWPMATAPITKERGKTQDAFVFTPKSPNQSEVKWTHSLFEIVESKSSQDRNNPKNSVKCEHFFLVWDTLRHSSSLFPFLQLPFLSKLFPNIHAVQNLWRFDRQSPSPSVWRFCVCSVLSEKRGPFRFSCRRQSQSSSGIN